LKNYSIFSLKFAGAAVAGALLWLTLPAHGQIAVQKQGYIPFTDEPINYRSNDLHDPVANLQKRLDKGEVKLEYEPKNGYLRSVLQLLNIPISSQTLVFSKTSFQYKKISPETPRALYFNDDVYVGQVHEGKALEFVSFDPTQGAIFYLLDEQKAEHPVLQRAELDCTQCHIAASTRNVPGVFLRSVYTQPTGTLVAKTPQYITGQQSPLSERWGGWYVTGSVGDQKHLGNILTATGSGNDGEATDKVVTDLSKEFDVSAYLSAHSDIVAHLVLAHQTQMHNLITQTNYQARVAVYNEAAKNKAAGLPENSPLSEAARKKYEAPAEELVRYLLFANEAPLTSPVKGDSGFAAEFEARGIRDPQGRSLRDFDLRTRIFKYPCSYLIYSDAFDSLPAPAKDYVYHRLLDVLTGHDQSPDFASLTASDRKAVLEILLATKPGAQEAWKQYIAQQDKQYKTQNN
jgi:hypothetical protein